MKQNIINLFYDFMRQSGDVEIKADHQLQIFQEMEAIIRFGANYFTAE